MSDRIIRERSQAVDKGRLDKIIVKHFPEFSRSRIQGMIRSGYVTVGGLVVDKPSELIEQDQEIILSVPDALPTDLVAENIPLAIIFENDDVLVINKPAGMVVHPAAGHDRGTLVNAVLGYAPDIEGIGGEERPGIVHRLDKDTSGIILVAKNERSHRFLQDQFRLRKVEKYYLALVDGKPPTSSGRIEAAIGRDASHRKKMAVTSPTKGREAISEYRILVEYRIHTLLEFHPLTGRTHQIRLHCTLLGCPIVGDRIYGHKNPTLDLNRHFLHASKLTVTLLGEKQPRTFEADLPVELKIILDQLPLLERNT